MITHTLFNGLLLIEELKYILPNKFTLDKNLYPKIEFQPFSPILFVIFPNTIKFIPLHIFSSFNKFLLSAVCLIK
jgi:hypothetical protein